VSAPFSASNAIGKSKAASAAPLDSSARWPGLSHGCPVGARRAREGHAAEPPSTGCAGPPLGFGPFRNDCVSSARQSPSMSFGARTRPLRAASRTKTTWRQNAIGARRRQGARSAREAACPRTNATHSPRIDREHDDGIRPALILRRQSKSSDPPILAITSISSHLLGMRISPTGQPWACPSTRRRRIQMQICVLMPGIPNRFAVQTFEGGRRIEQMDC
jgi:hypothetical protein